MEERIDEERVERDPLSDDPRLPNFFGPAWPTVAAFHALLADQGVLRGLIGPREVSRLWERHLLNSASVVPYLPSEGVVVDLGSGAGLPGVVVAAMVPTVEVVLLEPMERRTAWLTEVVERLEIPNATVRRARAQEALDLQADAVVTRAVASLEKLFAWALPLVRPGGQLIALKGGRAGEEIDAARRAAQRAKLSAVDLHEATTLDGLESTRVVVAQTRGAA